MFYTYRSIRVRYSSRNHYGSKGVGINERRPSHSVLRQLPLSKYFTVSERFLLELELLGSENRKRTSTDRPKTLSVGKIRCRADVALVWVEAGERARVRYFVKLDP
jgi:hypothetical protein